MKKGKIHVNNGSEIDRLSNEELRNCSYFCLECFRSWGYFRKRTNDYVCRHDGYITTSDSFKVEIEKIIERRNNFKIALDRSDSIQRTLSTIRK